MTTEIKFQSINDMYRTNYSKIKSLHYKLTRNHHTAEDLTQDTFEKAFKNKPSFENRAAFSTWLYQIALNTGIDYLRKKRETMLTSTSKEAYTTTPEDEMSGKEIETRLKQFLTNHPNKDSVETILLEMEGNSNEEISQLLKIPPGTARARVHRMRKELIDRLYR